MDEHEPFCYTCISSGHFDECESCNGSGLVESDDWDDHDGLTDCLWCSGRGGWWSCLGRERHDLEPGSIHRVPLAER